MTPRMEALPKVRDYFDVSSQNIAVRSKNMSSVRGGDLLVEVVLKLLLSPRVLLYICNVC